MSQNCRNLTLQCLLSQVQTVSLLLYPPLIIHPSQGSLLITFRGDISRQCLLGILCCSRGPLHFAGSDLPLAGLTLYAYLRCCVDATATRLMCGAWVSFCMSCSVAVLHSGQVRLAATLPALVSSSLIVYFGNPANEDDIRDSILRGSIDLQSEPWPSISEQAKDLIRKMLSQSPKNRMSTADALSQTSPLLLSLCPAACCCL